MSENSSTTEAEIHPTIAKLSDFSDRLSPMIVKELRQGLRTRTFTGTFLVLQVVLGFTMLGAMMSQSGDTGRLISSMVFFLFAIVAVILQPLRGITAVATELKDDTLEIMSLTRLSSIRIVYGKWASIVSQTALMLAATIPYLVLRYFFGGMQLFSELALLLTLFFLSVCLTAVTVGLSCSRSVILRALVPLALIPVGLMAISGLAFGREFGLLQEVFSFQDRETNIGFLVFIAMAAYVGYYFLDMGVGRIAAVAENHAFRKRLVSLILMGCILVILFLNPPAQTVSALVMVVFLCTIGIDICTETAVSVPSVVRPFVKRGRAATLIGRSFFYPGWHSGFFLLLVLFVATIVMGEMTFQKHRAASVGLPDELLLFIMGVFYTVVAPLLVVRIFINKIKDPFPGYVMVLVLSAVLTMLVTLFTEISRSGGDGLKILMSWIPGVWILFIERRDTEEGIIFTGIFLVVVCGALMAMAFQEYRRTAALEAMARASLAEDEES